MARLGEQIDPRGHAEQIIEVAPVNSLIHARPGQEFASPTRNFFLRYETGKGSCRFFTLAGDFKIEQHCRRFSVVLDSLSDATLVFLAQGGQE